MKLHHKSRLFLTLAVAVCSANFAFGYSYYACDGTKVNWDSDTVTIRAGATTFGEGDPYRSALVWVISRINKNPSDFEFNLSYGDTSLGRSNNQNEIWASTNSDYLQDDETGDWYPAVAWVRMECGANPRIVEADVVFNADRTWTSGTSKSSMTQYGGGARPFRTTAMHELGHAFGLAHVNSEYNIMGQDTNHLHTNSSEASAYLGEDASHGAVFLYGADSSSPEDVGVVHWRYLGADGEYSTHERTDILDSSGSLLSSTTVDDEPFFRVDNGETIQVQFTYENNGTTTHSSVDIGFYLSENDAITTSDDHLVTRSVGNLGRGNVYTTYHTVTLPSDLQPLTDYYIGAIIDESESISEEFESNNATYIGLRTKSFPTSTPTPTPTFRIIPIFTATATPTPSLRISPLFTPTPTPTPTLRLVPIGTATATPTRRTGVIRPTVPPIFETPIIRPVGTPITPPTELIIRDILEINPVFEQRSVLLRDTLSVFRETERPDNTDRGFQILPGYRLGPGVQPGMLHSLSLPDGTLLATAFPLEGRQPVLVGISEDGTLRDFARVLIEDIQVGDSTIPVDLVNVLSMDFDGKDRVSLLLKVFASEGEGERLFEAVVRTTITGPFQENAAVKDFSLH